MKKYLVVLENYLVKKGHGLAISSITAAEMFYGVFNSEYPEKNGANLANFFIVLTILDFDSGAAVEYGRIRAILRKKGTPIGQMDMLIAAHAKSKDLVLVTSNTDEFERVDGLIIENWSDRSSYAFYRSMEQDRSANGMPR
jgi:tRNA(fMet)-specific endonuclease VapC